MQAEPAAAAAQDLKAGSRKEDGDIGQAAVMGSPRSGGTRSASTWFGRAGPICVLPTPFAAASGSTGADATGTLTQQGSLNTGSSDDGNSAGRETHSGSSTDTPEDAQTRAEAGDAGEGLPALAGGAAVARLKRKISARPSAPMGRDTPNAGRKEAPPAALFDPQLVPGAGAALLDANAPAGSTALGGSDPAVVKGMSPSAAVLPLHDAAADGAHGGPSPALALEADAAAAPGTDDVTAMVESEPAAAEAAEQPAVSDGAAVGSLATLSTSSKSGKEVRRTVRTRRTTETLDQMSARMEAMAAQQAALEAYVLKVNSEKEHLIQQVHAMREKLEAAAAEASRLQRLRLEQHAAHQQAAMLQASQQQQQPQHQAQQQQLQAAWAAHHTAASQAPAPVFTGVQTFNEPVSTGAPDVPPQQSVSISVTRPGITVTSSAVGRPPAGQAPISAGPLAQSQQSRLGIPGVGPGPSGGSGPAYFMMQQQQYPRLGVPGAGPGPSGGSGSGYSSLGFGLGSAVHPGPPLRQRVAGQLPLHFQGPSSEGFVHPPASAGPMSMGNPYGQQSFGQQQGPPQLVRSSAPGPLITTAGGGFGPAGGPHLNRVSAPGGFSAGAPPTEHAQSLAQGRTRRQPPRAAATKAAAMVATATMRPPGPAGTAANAAAALHDLAPVPTAAMGHDAGGGSGMGGLLADPLDFLLTQMSLSLDELELPELPSL